MLEALLVYTTCPDSSANGSFPAWKSTIPTFNIKCDTGKANQSCGEAVGYLNFLINNYDYPPAKRYVFIHGHETSWHSPVSIFQVIKRLMRTDYWHQNTFGGFYPSLSGDWDFMTQRWGVPLYRYVFKGTSMPAEAPVTGTRWPCCGTFWVDSHQTRVRLKQEYILIRDRLIEWSLQVTDRSHKPVNRALGIVQDFPPIDSGHPTAGWYCGRVAEYTWALLVANMSIVKPPSGVWKPFPEFSRLPPELE
jgi:hypothetical protein